MNSITLVGRIGRDPELKSTTTGKNYATFSIAVNKRIKPTDPNERDSDWFTCKVWGKSSDYVANYLAKGSLVSVTGSIGSRRYTDKQGVDREVWEVNCDQVNGLDRKPEGQRASAPAASQGDSDFDPFA